MKKVREQGLKKNLIYNIVYQVVVVLSPLVVTPKFSRIMGPDYVGLRSFTFSIVFYFAVIGALGLDMYGQRRIAIVKDDKAERSKVFWSIYTVKAASCFISLCVYACAFVLFNSDATMRILYLCWTLYLVREMLNPVWYLPMVVYRFLHCDSAFCRAFIPDTGIDGRAESAAEQKRIGDDNQGIVRLFRAHDCRLAVLDD